MSTRTVLSGTDTSARASPASIGNPNSKWNPIEHRLFPEISKHCAGEPLDSLSEDPQLHPAADTETGLRVSAHLDRRYYAAGFEPIAEELSHLRLYPHQILPHWNYRNYTIQPDL
jgi:hypothetical protein